MRLNRDDVVAHAAATGFQLEILEKVLRLVPLLSDVGEHPYLGPRLVLKGGTAIQLALGTPRRLSVDLDFNYVGALDRDIMLSERPLVEQEIVRLAAARRYRVRASRQEHAGRKFYLEYRSYAGLHDRLEVDVNFLNRQPLGEPALRRLWQPPDSPAPVCRVVADEELWAGKISALLGRSLPRDLFDVGMMSERSPALLESARFRHLTIAWSGVLDHPLHAYGRERIERLGEEAVARQLHPMLRRDDRPTAAELAERAWAVVAPLIDLSDGEREYCDRLQKGELRLDLLLEKDDALRERLERHPALQWKAKNAREHHRRE
jgi:hypothetical protein